MPRSPTPPQRASLPLAARSAVALAALAAMAAFAAGLAEPAAAAETAYLATVGGALLVCLAAAGGGDALLAATAVLAVAAVWVPPAGPARGAAVVTLLAAALALAAARRVRTPPARRGFAEHLAILAPLALALQVLVRSERLLLPQVDARFLVGLLVLPFAGAAAAAVLAAGRGLPAALLATAVAVLPAPGFNVASTAAVAALAAADLLRRPGRIGAGPGPGRPQVFASGLALPLAQGGVLAVLAVAVAWEPRAGLVAVAAAVALAGGRTGAAAAAVLALAAAAYFPARAWEPAWEQIALLVLVLPALPFALRRRGLAPALAGLALALAAAWAVPGPAAAAAPLALLALLAAERTAGRAVLLPRAASPAAPPAAATAGAGPSAALAAAALPAPLWPQAIWTAALLFATALLASYPWLRPEPLRGALALAGLAPRGADAVLAVAAVTLLGAAAGFLARPAAPGAVPAPGVLSSPSAAPAETRWRDRGPGRWTGPWAGRARGLAGAGAVAVLAAVALAGLLTLGPRSAGTAHPVVTGPGVVHLDADHPRLVVELAGGPGDGSGADPAGAAPVRSLLVDSTLSNAAGLAAETPVAVLRLAGGRGEPAAPGGEPAAPGGEWVLRAGRDTAEWAARRPDVAAVAAHQPPPPWVAWVAPEGFFGQLYRSRWRLRDPLPATRLEVVRAPGLPPATVVHLHRVEVRRGTPVRGGTPKHREAPEPGEDLARRESPQAGDGLGRRGAPERPESPDRRGASAQRGAAPR